MNCAAEEAIRERTRLTQEMPQPSAHLDSAHVGHIPGALGTIHHGDTAPRVG